MAYLLAGETAPRGLLVAVHGRSRSLSLLESAFAATAAQAGFALVLPNFETAAFRRYQVLAGAAGPTAAANALNAVIDDACGRLGLLAGPVALFGHSGGAQFAHRYAMLQPHRVSALVIAAAGWYTMPTPLLAFPQGTAPSETAPEGLAGLGEFLAVPQLVLVGERDTARSGSVRTSPALDAMQGRNRLERASRYVEAVAAAAERRGLPAAARLELMPNVAHSFQNAVRNGRLVDKTFWFLQTTAVARPVPLPA